MNEEGLKDHNVLFVTLDSCRYDTVRAAHLPFLGNLGRIRPAQTHGTYTLPAHMSFFMGYLPSSVDPPYEPYYSSHIKQLWRLSGGRPCPRTRIGIEIVGGNVLEGYRRRGFKTVGAGGVRWFRHPILQSLFEEFVFYGKTDKSSVFDHRTADEFPLNHIDELVRMAGPDRFFLFVNCPETHVPYDFGDGHALLEARPVLEEFSETWGFKRKRTEPQSLDYSRLQVLHSSQVLALESMDAKLQCLIEKLTKPLLIVICGDHGECFGEDDWWGHGYPHPKVMEVPLLITCLEQ